MKMMRSLHAHSTLEEWLASVVISGLSEDFVHLHLDEIKHPIWDSECGIDLLKNGINLLQEIYKNDCASALNLAKYSVELIFPLPSASMVPQSWDLKLLHSLGVSEETPLLALLSESFRASQYVVNGECYSKSIPLPVDCSDAFSGTFKMWRSGEEVAELLPYHSSLSISGKYGLNPFL
ncbi:MAG: hypothetical protein JST01_27930 [Cyanobacteria bacterium SZAS TMP-1]|nr:hypothetical protein [Cyanobacteria bacterium SZAS TMP-1]